MPKRARSTATGRVRGYRYAVRRDGSRYRVYSAGFKRRARSTRTSDGSRRFKKTSQPLKTTRDLFGDTIMGYGAYRRVKRSNSTPIMEPQVPKIRNTKGGGMIVNHCEFIADIPSSSVFRSLTLALNPGLNQTFPWLSRVAQNFEEWLPRGMIFEYRTTSSDTLLAASPALGSVIIATQYNAINPDFTGKAQMENYEGAVSCKPSVSMIHQIETARSRTVMDEMYIRTQPLTSTNADLRMYDLGKTQIAIVGSQTNGPPLGELWISYEIELRKPKIPEDPIIEAAHWWLGNVADGGETTGQTPAFVFGTNAPGGTSQPDAGWIPNNGSTMYGSRIGRVASLFGGASYIQFGEHSRGTYLVNVQLSWNVGGSQGDWVINPQSNCTLLNAFGNNANPYAPEFDDTTMTAQSTNVSIMVRVTGPYATFSLGNTSDASGGYATGGCDVFITELPDNME